MSTDCQFEQVELGVVKCRVCGFTFRTDWPPERVHKRCWAQGAQHAPTPKQMQAQRKEYVMGLVRQRLAAVAPEAGYRSQEEIATIIARPGFRCPTGCGKNLLDVEKSAMARLIDDLICRDRWRKEWGERMGTRQIRWAYGITTHPSRVDTLLPQTLHSLEKAGFPKPHVFLDGEFINHYAHLRFTGRTDPVGIVGNWMLGMLELLIVNPCADRYLMFQDDIQVSCNLREYLEQCEYPKGKYYYNLYSFPENEALSGGTTGWHESNQNGLGALGLMFDRDGLVDLMATERYVRKPLEASRPSRAIDGAVLIALRSRGYKEYVHNPSLVQHVGMKSTMPGKPPNAVSQTFRGEGFDLLELLQ